MKYRSLPFNILFFLVISAYAQDNPTSYSDDFNTTKLGTGWIENAQYQLSATGTAMEINIDKYKPWKGFELQLEEVYDFSSNPYVNIKAKGQVPFILHVYFVDVNGIYTLSEARVHQAERFINLFYDMTINPQDGFDITQVERMIFTFNGASVSLVGTAWFDELQVGGTALKMASLGGIPDQVVPRNSKGNRILITDVKNTSSIVLTGGESMIKNVDITPVESGMVNIDFDAVPDVSGREVVTLTASGMTGYQDNSFQFELEVESNHPPGIDQINDIEVAAGSSVQLRLSGITDGNISSDQDILFSVTSDNSSVITDPIQGLSHKAGSPYATLSFETLDEGNTTVTVTLDDQAAEDNITQMQFDVTAYHSFNHAPLIDLPASQEVFAGSGKKSVLLEGIGDGDGTSQELTFSADPLNVSVVSSASIQYDQGAETAILEYFPANAGKTAIEITIMDNGGTTENNGDASTIIQMQVEVRQPALTGYTIPMSDFVSDQEEKLWKIDAGETQSIEYVSFDGFDEVLKIDLNDKSTWSGLWYRNPELDLEEHPYMVCDVYSVDNEIGFHAYFWDNEGRRNLPGAHLERKTIEPDSWNSVVLDFRGDGMIEDSDGNPINIDRVDSLLFNYHDGFGWPFHGYTGTLYIKNIRVGSDAADAVPALAPHTTIDPPADIVLPLGIDQYIIQLTGISNGIGETEGVTLEAISSKPDLIPEPEVSAVDNEGNATLTIDPSEGTGSTEIILTVSAPNAITAEHLMLISIMDPDPEMAEEILIEPLKRHQVIQGFGTFSNSESLIDLYVREMGASSVRIGLIANQVEHVNDNNDPHVLNRSALDYSALDFDYYRKLKEAGVETFILTSWSPPAWMKDNLSLNYQQAGVEDNCDHTTNKLSYHYYEEFAESMVAVVKMFQEESDIIIEAIGLQNEPAFHEPYASAILDLVRYPELITIVGKRFEEEQITTRFFMPEQAFSQGFNSMEAYIDSLQANDEANAYCDIIATHGYAADGIQPGIPDYQEWQDMWNNAREGEHPKELWMTETTRAYEDWSDAIGFAGALHGALTAGNVSLWNTWSFEGMQVIRGKPTPMLFTASNYFRYIRPGAQRISATSGNEELLVSAFENDDEVHSTVIVIVNKGDSAQSVRIAGDEVPVAYDIYTTSQHRNREYMGMIAGNVLLLPPSSVTTLVEVDYNLKPTIDSVDDFSISENAGIQQLSLTGITDGGDPEGQGIAISAESSDAEVISIQDVTYTAPSETATLHYEVTGVAGQSAEITITVEDDGGTQNGSINYATTVFTITVNEPVNTHELILPSIKVYPNPVNQVLFVENIAYVKTIHIRSMNGKLLWMKSLNGQQSLEINTAFLTEGIYMLEFIGSENTIKIFKMGKK